MADATWLDIIGLVILFGMFFGLGYSIGKKDGFKKGLAAGMALMRFQMLKSMLDARAKKVKDDNTEKT